MTGDKPGDIVQRYRFRVRTADGRELLSHVASVSRPRPPAELAKSGDLPVKASDVPAKSTTSDEPVNFTDVPVHQILVAIHAQKQGDLLAAGGFKDQAGTASKHQLCTQEFEFSTLSPRDVQSGLPTGQRMHKPVVFTAALGPAAPQLYTALCTNEALPTVVFDCYGPARDGGSLALAQTVKLTDANVASIDFVQPNLRDEKLVRLDEWQRIALTFGKIELSGPAGTASDDWQQGS